MVSSFAPAFIRKRFDISPLALVLLLAKLSEPGCLGAENDVAPATSDS